MSYEFMWGPGLLFQSKIRESWLTDLEIRKEETAKRFDPNNNPPHTWENNSIKKEARLAKLEARQKVIAEEVKSMNESYAIINYRWGVRGLAFLLLGFIFQAIGVLTQ